MSAVSCDLLVLSYNNESWLNSSELEAICAGPDTSGRPRHVATLSFDSARYVGARIGIFDPSGRKVGRVSHLSNRELLVIAGTEEMVTHVIDACGDPASSDSGGSDLAVSGAEGDVAPLPARIGVGTVDRLQQAT